MSRQKFWLQQKIKPAQVTQIANIFMIVSLTPGELIALQEIVIVIAF